MKKMFTLIAAAAGMVSIAAAQPGKSNEFSRDNKNGNSQYGGSTAQQPGFDKGKTSGYNDYSFSTRDKDAQIQKINREYDQKIMLVKKSWRMRPQEKTKQIKMLEAQRRQEIKEVQDRWERSNRFNNGHDNDWGKGKNNSHH